MRLRETQREMAALLMAPPGANRRAIAAAASRIIKPNGRLSSLERLDIYSRSYWRRLLDSLAEDFPGLRAIIGEKDFERMAQAYLTERPSCSFTLRDLGSRLIQWLEKNPACLRQHRELALDMARLEWAHIVAFDGPQDPVLAPEHLLAPGPGLRVGVQPYITLLALQYPVDALRVMIRNDDDDFGTTSNAAGKRKRRSVQKLGRTRQTPLFVAVHRVDSSVYYRRLEPEEFRLLEALRAGRSVPRAIAQTFQNPARPAEEIPALLESWFAAWAQLGWLTVSLTNKKGRKSK